MMDMKLTCKHWNFIMNHWEENSLGINPSMIYTYICKISDNKLFKTIKAEPETFNIWLNWPIQSMIKKKRLTKSMMQCGIKKISKSLKNNPKISLFMHKILMIPLSMSKDKLKESKMYTIKELEVEPKNKTLMDSFINLMKLLEKTMSIKIVEFLTYKERTETFKIDWKNCRKKVVVANVK